MSGSGVVVAFLRPYFGRRGFVVVGIFVLFVAERELEKVVVCFACRERE